VKRTADVQVRDDERLEALDSAIRSCQGNLRGTNEFLAKSVAAIAGDVTQLAQSLGATEMALHALEARLDAAGMFPKPSSPGDGLCTQDIHELSGCLRSTAPEAKEVSSSLRRPTAERAAYSTMGIGKSERNPERLAIKERLQTSLSSMSLVGGKPRSSVGQSKGYPDKFDCPPAPNSSAKRLDRVWM